MAAAKRRPIEMIAPPSGHVFLARSIFADSDFRAAAFSEREAFIWLIAMAAWQRRDSKIGGKVVSLERGQVLHSLRFLADAWGWEKMRVSRYLKRLQECCKIECESETAGVRITLLKYEENQSLAKDARQQPENSVTEMMRECQKTETEYKKGIREEDNKKDVSNETSIGARGEIGGDLFGGGEPKAAPAKAKATRSKRAKLSTDYTPEFLEFWAAYPKNARMSKAKAFEQFSELTPEDRRKAIVAAPLYAAQVARLRTPEDKIKFAHNWLAERYFDALTDPELMAATERHALVVATPGNGRATMADKMAILAELVEREENGQR